MRRHGPVDVFHRRPAQLGEGVCWHDARQTVWWVDITGRRFFEARADGTAVRSLACPQMIAALAPTTSGQLVGALHDGIHLIDPDTGNTTPFACPAGHDPAAFRFNDAKVDPAGRLWAGTLSLQGCAGAACLYRIDGDGAIAVMRTGVSISNGLAWSADRRTLYYIDSLTRAVQAFPFSAGDGTVGEPEIVLRFQEEDGLPDGCAMDAEGHLWIAHWGGAKVTRWDLRQRRLLGRIDLPVRHVTSCAFGGPRLDVLFITTAVGDGPGPVEPEAGFVFRVEPGVVGPELPCFRVA